MVIPFVVCSPTPSFKMRSQRINRLVCHQGDNKIVVIPFVVYSPTSSFKMSSQRIAKQLVCHRGDKKITIKS